MKLIIEILKALFKKKEVSSLDKAGLDFIKKWEGLRLTAYMPTPNDKWTIGYGHTATARPGMTISIEQAEDLLKLDVSWAEKAVKNRVTVPLNQPQFNALVSFVYNIGETAFAKSTLLKVLNQGKYGQAADELLRWNKQAGNVLKGLVRRRQEERSMFLK